jgi:hypothetical protein
MGGIDIEEAAAVGTELIDGDLRGGRPPGPYLLARGVVAGSTSVIWYGAKLCTTPWLTETKARINESGNSA